MHLNDSSSIAVHFKSHSLPKYKFRKILIENSTILAHEIKKTRLQILEAQNIKTKTPIINKINLENCGNVSKHL